MNRWILVATVMVFALTMPFGCSRSGVSPVSNSLEAGEAPGLSQGESVQEQVDSAPSQTHLLGYYDFTFEPASKSIEIVPARSTMFAANIVTYLNGSSPKLAFKVNSTTEHPSYIDVDIDVTIKHPLGSAAYDGYDVRAVLIGNGSETMAYNNDLKYPASGQDQYLLNADGYTRWFNPSEFGTPGLFGYTPGQFATPGYEGTATLNPYKYFGQGLDATGNVWTYLNSTNTNIGVFPHSTTLTRNYQLRFPIPSPNVTYGYAIVANWESETVHPAHAPEIVAANITVTPNVYYVSPSVKGGKIIADISLFGWKQQPTNIYIESTVLSAPHKLAGAELIPTGGGSNYSTYHVEIPADNVNGLTGNEFWVIAECTGQNYNNSFGVTNLAGTDTLAACFRSNLPVTDKTIRITAPNGGETWRIGTHNITWVSTNLEATTVKIEYSKDDFVSDVHVINAETVNTGTYPWDMSQDSSPTVKIRITSVFDPTVWDVSDNYFTILCGWVSGWGGNMEDSADCMAVDQSNNIYVCGVNVGDPLSNYYGFLRKYTPWRQLLWERKWGATTGFCLPYDIDVDSSGNVYIAGSFSGTEKFDPAGTCTLSSNGYMDAFLSKFSSNGAWVATKAWGGNSGYNDEAFNVAVDSSSNMVYVLGAFGGTVNFNPWGGGFSKSSNGNRDIFVSKFSLNLIWFFTSTWGNAFDEDATGLDTDGFGNVYVAGEFQGTVNFGGGNMTSAGGYDAYLTKLNGVLSWQWTNRWGSGGWDDATCVIIDVPGNVTVGGFFNGTVLFGSNTEVSSGIDDAFISRFTSGAVWGNTQTWRGCDSIRNLAVDAAQNIYVTSEFSGAVDFDPSSGVYQLTSAGGRDVYLTKFTLALVWQWARAWGGSGDDDGWGVGADSSGCVYASGNYGSTPCNFAPTGAPCNDPVCNLTPTGGVDAFLVKFVSDGCW